MYINWWRTDDIPFQNLNHSINVSNNMTDMYCHFVMILLLLHYYLVYFVLFDCVVHTRAPVRQTHRGTNEQEKKWNEFDIDWHISYWHWQVHCSVSVYAMPCLFPLKKANVLHTPHTKDLVYTFQKVSSVNWNVR